jgi:uncharacterized protein YggE
VRAVNKAGAIVDAITKAGVTNVESISFGSSDPSRAQAQATAKAYTDARSKADEAAKAAGLHISGIGQIDFGGGVSVRPMMRMAAMAAPSAPAPTVLDSGNVNVTATLTVVFLAQP